MRIRVRSSNRSNKGFTIIEVLIVLSLAALIMLIVFMAIPSLQRNSRNAARKADATTLLSALFDWTQNNGGALPLSGPVAAVCYFDTCPFLSNVTLNYYKPLTSTNFVYIFQPAVPPDVSSYGSPSIDQVYLLNALKCNPAGNATSSPAALTITGATPRTTVALYGYEAGGTTYVGCLSG